MVTEWTEFIVHKGMFVDESLGINRHDTFIYMVKREEHIPMEFDEDGMVQLNKMPKHTAIRPHTFAMEIQNKPAYEKPNNTWQHKTQNLDTQHNSVHTNNDPGSDGHSHSQKDRGINTWKNQQAPDPADD